MTGGYRVGASGCRAATKQGRACRAPVLPGGAYCFSHEPALAEVRRAARSRGATKANKLRAIEGRRARLDSGEALLAFAGRLVHDVVDGRLTPEVARVALYGTSICRSLVETGDLERRLAAVEAALAADRAAGGSGWR
jgi:hypothetical protein